MSILTLDQLAQEQHTVYLDNSILSQDQNFSEIRQGPYFRRGVSIPSIAERLGAAKSFHDVKESILNRQLNFASRISSVIESCQSLRSSALVIGGHYALIEHLERTLDFLMVHSCKRSGDKEAKLREIIGYHQHSYDQLLQRSTAIPGDGSLAYYLRANRLHYPPDHHFIKRKLPSETSEGDSQLVSQAVMDSLSTQKPVSIVSADFDIINLVRNYGLALQHKVLPAHISSNNSGSNWGVTVYFPHESSWRPSLGLQFMCNTAGEQKVYGVRGNYF